MTDDAEELGVQHAGINVAFNELMREGPGDDPADVVPFESNGRDIPLRRRRGSPARRADQTPLGQRDPGQPDPDPLPGRRSRPRPGRSCTHPDAAVGSGIGLRVQHQDRGGRRALHRGDGVPGRPLHAGRPEHTAGRSATSSATRSTPSGCGPTPATSRWRTSSTYYARAVRIAWQATRKYWNGARTYISLTHCWTIVCGENPRPGSRPASMREGRIDQLNALTKRTGDVGWNVAHHPYPENLFNPAFWDDETAMPGFDTPRITFKNIEVLPDYLAQDDRCATRARAAGSSCRSRAATHPATPRRPKACRPPATRTPITRCGSSTASTRSSCTGMSTTSRRAGSDSGCGPGTTRAPSRPCPAGTSVSYDVFAGIDTARFAGADGVREVRHRDSRLDRCHSGVRPDQLAERSEPSKVGTRLGRQARARAPAGRRSRTDNDGWRASDNAVGGRTVPVAMRAREPCGFGSTARLCFRRGPATPRPGRAPTSCSPSLSMPARTAHLNLAVRVPQPGAGDFQPDNVFYAKVQAYARDGQVAYGPARLDPQRGWNQLSLDLSGWSPRSELARIKVWVRGTTNDDWQGSFDLDHVSVCPGTLLLPAACATSTCRHRCPTGAASGRSSP